MTVTGQEVNNHRASQKINRQKIIYDGSHYKHLIRQEDAIHRERCIPIP